MGSGIYCFGASSNCSKDPREDSSSQCSPEVQPLFLAWLPEEERHFMEASEGLRNSQKDEVAWHIDVLLGSDRPAASVSFSNLATDLQAAPVSPHSPSCMILHVMMHLPKIIVTRLLPVSPALEEIGTLRHLLTVKA